MIINEKCETSTGSAISINRYMGKIPQPLKKTGSKSLGDVSGFSHFLKVFFFQVNYGEPTPAPKVPRIASDHPFR